MEQSSRYEMSGSKEVNCEKEVLKEITERKRNWKKHGRQMHLETGRLGHFNKLVIVSQPSHF